jgi:calcineurin-like phosphoesterase family protein
VSNIWFTSDLHLGHEKVAEIRGFDSVAEHDDVIAENWRNLVGSKDQVYILGDLTGKDDAVSSALVRLRWWPGRKHLIAGNHCPVHPMHKRAGKWISEYLRTFDTVAPFGQRKVGDRKVLLSHFPYDGPGGDRGENRHRQWRLPDLGEWLLHGHTHMEDQRVHDGKQIHVGVDAWDLKPIDLNTVNELIVEAEAAKPAIQFDLRSLQVEMELAHRTVDLLHRQPTYLHN